MVNSVLLLQLFRNMEQLDAVRLNFSPTSLTVMNIAIAFVMFGVALDIRPKNFKDILLKPKPVIIGVLSQYIMLPALTFLLILLIKPTPTVAFGMILVASCPGGNISNFISSLAKANVALSVSLTAISTILCLFMTPLNFAFWGGLYAKHSPLLVPIKIDSLQMFYTVVILLGIPVTLGMLFSNYFPKVTKKILKPIKLLSILVFIGFVIGAFAGNYTYFIKYISVIFMIVFLHNSLALVIGYVFPSLFKLDKIDRRTISIETGIQNSGLGLILIFSPKIFPQTSIGGMAFIAAWWGIWHIISGMGLAFLYSKHPVKSKIENR